MAAIDPTSVNSGSFGAAAGGAGNAISQAMARRGLGEPATGQVTPGAATAQERGVPQTVGANPPQAIPGQAPRQQGIGEPPTKAESEVIVKALDSRLKTLGKLQESGIQV